jgi:hypothetical protein
MSEGILCLRGGDVLTLDCRGQRAAVDRRVDRERAYCRAGQPSASREGSGDLSRPGARVVDVGGCLVLPGLVQGHMHLGQTLFRGLAERRRLLAWLRERIWPLEAAHDDESAYWGAMLRRRRVPARRHHLHPGHRHRSRHPRPVARARRQRSARGRRQVPDGRR